MRRRARRYQFTVRNDHARRHGADDHRFGVATVTGRQQRLVRDGADGVVRVHRSGARPTGIATCSDATTLSSSAAAQSVTGYATDVAGNVSSATVSGVKVDTVPPTVVCEATPTFFVGEQGVVRATVADEHSGPAGGSLVTGSANTTRLGRGRGRSWPARPRRQHDDPELPLRRRNEADGARRLSGAAQVQRRRIGASGAHGQADHRRGSPIAGQVVRFTTGTRQVCTATTNSRGEATCAAGLSWIAALLSGGYTATYVGNGAYQPSSDTAGLVG